MRIVLVNPPLSGSERYGAFAGSGTYLPPLSLAYLAAMVEGQHDVRILDAAAEELTPAATAEEVLRYGPELVGVTTIAALWGPFSREVLEHSRPAHYLESISDLPTLLAVHPQLSDLASHPRAAPPPPSPAGWWSPY